MKKLQLKNVTPIAAESRGSHPVVEVDKETLALLGQFVSIEPQFKTLKAQRETLSSATGPRIRAIFFRRFLGMRPDSTMIVDVKGTRVKLVTKNKYSTALAEEGPLVAAIGAKAVNQHFRQATVISLNFDKVPEAAQEKFAAAVIELAQKHGAGAAVTVKQCIQPVPGFHEARTSLLSPEQNDRIDSIIPTVAYPQL